MATSFDRISAKLQGRIPLSKREQSMIRGRYKILAFINRGIRLNTSMPGAFFKRTALAVATALRGNKNG